MSQFLNARISSLLPGTVASETVQFFLASSAREPYITRPSTLPAALRAHPLYSLPAGQPIPAQGWRRQESARLLREE